MKLNLNFLGEGRSKTKNLPWEEYRYFPELYNDSVSHLQLAEELHHAHVERCSLSPLVHGRSHTLLTYWQEGPVDETVKVKFL